MRTKRLLAALGLAALLASPVIAIRRADEPAFASVPGVGASVGWHDRQHDGRRVDADDHPMLTVPLLDQPVGGRPRPTRPLVTVPESPVIVADRSHRGGPPSVGSAGAPTRRVAGSASWYCGHGSACTKGYPGGLYAAAGPRLRVGDWRGRVVEVVDADGRRVLVRLIDWCACPNGRVLDLYSDAFQRLGPLSRGVLKVTVSWN